MLIYPEINPIAVHIGPLRVHWYGIMYLIGFVGGWALLRLRARHRADLNFTFEQISDLLFYVALGIILGGRIGYMLFYDFPALVHNPLNLFKVWNGRMSFHGGAAGVLIAMWIYGRIHGRRFFDLMDFIVPVVPIGLGAGRIGNFINGELWGKIAYLPWSMRLPCSDPRFLRYCHGAVTGYSPPHQPNQLYEFLLEGVVMFTVLWIFSQKPRPRMAIAGMFGLLYGVFRFAIEFERLPDPQLGYIAFGWMTMGQILSLPLIFFGLLLIGLAYRRKSSAVVRQQRTSEV
jgi:phosphatidylglycerol:prolipoprotein diacylglycerol transferase